MPAPRGKRLAMIFGTVGVHAMVVAGVAANDRLREQWHILRLSSSDETTRLSALDALVGMQSIRAVPALIRLGVEEKERPLVVWTMHGTVVLDRLAYAPFQIGPDALPILLAESSKAIWLRELIDLAPRLGLGLGRVVRHLPPPGASRG